MSVGLWPTSAPALGTHCEDPAVHCLAGAVGAFLHGRVEDAHTPLARGAADATGDCEHPRVAYRDPQRGQDRILADDALLKFHGDDGSVRRLDQLTETI